MNTDCKKCGAPMQPLSRMRDGMPDFFTTAYRCVKCGHWNDFKRRKGYAEYKAATTKKESP